ncbi:bacteriocin [Nostoc sp. GT001]|uniref:bacteriocin n=1 Tax=Nostoc sp. GT001 TaxID=3056647 RepID=UPI0025AA62DE|nr:bacteriocin [Nostoc sp. GT001]MDM9586316.1 bacteriocin [Nostoc sp. GT001]
MLKIFSTKKQATKQTPTLIQQDLELFEELSDAELMAVVGGFKVEVDGSISAKCVQDTLACLAAKSLMGCTKLIVCE